VNATQYVAALRRGLKDAWLPRRIVFDSAATPRLPISTLLPPVVKLNPVLTKRNVTAPGRVDVHLNETDGGVLLPSSVFQ
jgi:hypothetical protein